MSCCARLSQYYRIIEYPTLVVLLCFVHVAKKKTCEPEPALLLDGYGSGLYYFTVPALGKMCRLRQLRLRLGISDYE